MKGDGQQAIPAPLHVLTPPAPTPLIFSVPHAGLRYPGLDADHVPGGVDRLRGLEDPLVDRLVEPAVALGATVLVFDLARAFVDVNRDPREIDPLLLETPAPDRARPTARTRAGLGVTPRLGADGRPILNRRLPLSEIDARIALAHAPYHAALGDLIETARAAFGFALLLDWHSMPTAAAEAERRRGGVKPEIVLGDRHGQACDPVWAGAVRGAFEMRGRQVLMNRPYAGGHVTERWGRPEQGVSALQIEIDRNLYVDETSLQPLPGFDRLSEDVLAVTRALMARAA